MAIDHIRYDILAQEALRGLVRKVLADAAKNGLLGEHHFSITFDTTAEGVRISARLREQHPAELTIILQHQFWDLAVHEDHFEVGLAFGGAPERIAVPFAAIKSFFDPSVQFGLQFETIAETADEAAPAQAPAASEPSEKPRKPARQRQPQTAAPALATPASPPAAAPAPTGPKLVEPAPDKPAGGAEVVHLDRFRKK